MCSVVRVGLARIGQGPALLDHAVVTSLDVVSSNDVAEGHRLIFAFVQVVLKIHLGGIELLENIVWRSAGGETKASVQTNKTLEIEDTNELLMMAVEWYGLSRTLR